MKTLNLRSESRNWKEAMADLTEVLALLEQSKPRTILALYDDNKPLEVHIRPGDQKSLDKASEELKGRLTNIERVGK